MNTVTVILLPVTVLAAVMLIRTLMCRAGKYTEIPVPDIAVDIEAAARRLSGAVQIKTIAHDDISKTDMHAFTAFAEYLEKSYPLAHRKMTREIINGASILYRWEGKSGSSKPALFLAHIDVVPVEDGTESDWKYPPFSGAVSEGAVWGRGTQDIKNQLVALFEAAELMIADNFVPARDIYFAFGHDEETRRYDGADIIAARLKERKLAFEFVLDEGGNVIDNAVAGIRKPVAFIGIAEKGFVNVKITAKSAGGHSSMPPVHTAAGMLSLAVAEIEAHRRPLKLTVPVIGMFRALAPEMNFGIRFILSNLWLFAPLFKKIFSGTESGSAFLRTTTAPTMLSGSDAPNVLPLNASAVVNARILHGESSISLKKHLEKVIKSGSVSISMNQVYEPSKISPVDSYGFLSVTGAISAIWPDAVIAPYLVVGGTDARKYEELTDCVYRFTPMRTDNSEMKQVHGTDEHISMKNIEDSIKFYMAMFTR